jgi:hypothetical protein
MIRCWDAYGLDGSTVLLDFLSEYFCSFWEVIFTWIKRAALEARFSLSSTTEVKNEWSQISIPPYTFMTCIGLTLPLPTAL